MAATTMVHVSVDESIKNQATETLASMGLTVSDAVRVFLTRVVTDQQLPFALQAPNAATRAAKREARRPAEGGRSHQGLRQGLDPALALRPLRHEAAEGSDAAAGSPRRTPRTGVARSPAGRRLGRPSGMPYRRRFPADLPAERRRRCRADHLRPRRKPCRSVRVAEQARRGTNGSGLSSGGPASQPL